MMTEKSFWIPKIPCLYGCLLAVFHWIIGLYGSSSPDWETWRLNMLLTGLYLLLYIGLAVGLNQFSNRGAEPVWFASVHWSLILLFSLLACVGRWEFATFLFQLLAMPCLPVWILYPRGGVIALSIYSGLLTFFFVRGLYRVKHVASVNCQTKRNRKN